MHSTDESAHHLHCDDILEVLQYCELAVMWVYGSGVPMVAV